jgi:hypothetical protein
MAAGLAVCALLSAGAGAATICVGIEAPGCESSKEKVQEALESASSSPAGDRVVIGPGRFEGPFKYLPAGGGGRIEVVGQGPPTVLTAPTPTATGVTVLEAIGDSAGDGSAVSNLTVRIPAGTGTAVDSGIYADSVSGVRVASDAIEPPSSKESFGVELPTPGGSLRNSVVELVGGGTTEIGVKTEGGSEAAPIVVADSRITAPTAIRVSAQATSVVRTRVLANRVGVEACNGPVTVEDSLIRVFGNGTGLLAAGDNLCGTSQGSLVARQVTIVGTGSAGAEVGAAAEAGAPGQDPSVDVSLSILRDLHLAFLSEGSASAAAAVAVGASDFEAGRHAELPGAGAASFAQAQPNIDADPLFTNELLSEFTLRPGSPAIDSAYSPPLAPGESATDLNGSPRVLDGNGDGLAARDMGAFEAPAAPTPPDTTPPDTRILSAKRKGQLRAGPHGFVFRVRFASTEASSTFQCRLDAGRFRPCSSPFQRRLAAGMHRFEVRAVDAAGNVDPTPARENLRIARAPRKHHAHRRHRGS